MCEPCSQNGCLTTIAGVRTRASARAFPTGPTRRCYLGIGSLAIIAWPRSLFSVGFITSTVSSELRREAARRARPGLLRSTAVVVCDESPQRTPPATHRALEHLHDRPGRTSSGRRPPATGQPATRSTANAASIHGSERHRSADDLAVSVVRATQHLKSHHPMSNGRRDPGFRGTAWRGDSQPKGYWRSTRYSNDRWRPLL